MTELEKKLTNALLIIRNHINEPEVITSIIDKNIGTDKDVLPDDPAMNNPEAGQQNLTTEREAADKIKDTIKAVVSNARKLTPDGVPEDDDHFGEEQAAGLAAILKGLNEGPNDNRW